VDIDAVEEGKDDDIIADDVDEVIADGVDDVDDDDGNQDEEIGKGDDCTDIGTDSDDAPLAPYSKAELRTFTAVISNLGGNLYNREKLGRKIENTFYKEGQDEWAAWDASRKEGDTVLEVVTKLHDTQTREMSEVIDHLAKLQISAMESFVDTVRMLSRKPVFSAGRVMEEMQAQAVADSERIFELKDELQKKQHEISVLNALQWEYNKLLGTK
jgi:hypothetical protein